MKSTLKQSRHAMSYIAKKMFSFLLAIVLLIGTISSITPFLTVHAAVGSDYRILYVNPMNAQYKLGDTPVFSAITTADVTQVGFVIDGEERIESDYTIDYDNVHVFISEPWEMTIAGNKTVKVYPRINGNDVPAGGLSTSLNVVDNQKQYVFTDKLEGGNWLKTDDVNTHNFTFTNNSIVKFSLTGEYRVNAFCTIVVYNSLNEEVYRFQAGRNRSGVTGDVNLPSGKYYANIYDEQLTSGTEYTLVVNYRITGSNDENEPNDSIISANSLGLNSSINGVINYHNGEDWYKFSLSKAGNTLVSLAVAYERTAGHKVMVYNSDKEIVGSFYSGYSGWAGEGRNGISKIMDLAVGDYTICVSDTFGSVGGSWSPTGISYTLTVNYAENFTKITNAKTSFNGHDYQMFDLSLTWQDAKAYCEQQGGHLVTVSSQMEQDFINSLVSSTSSKGEIWLGANAESGTWKWITGEEWKYANWIPGEPNGGQPWIYMIMHGGKWDESRNARDEHGLTNVGFICEWGVDDGASESYPADWGNIAEDGITVGLNEIPASKRGSETVNFSWSGMHITDYTYATDNKTGDTTVKFNVWNTTAKSGAVIVCDSSGNEVNEKRIWIKKYNPGISSLEEWFKKGKEIWNGFGYLFKWETYKLNTKKTPVSITLPKGGYCLITNDPEVDTLGLTLDTLDFLGMSLSAVDSIGKVSWPSSTTALAERLGQKSLSKMVGIAGSVYKQQLLRAFVNIKEGHINSDEIQSLLEMSQNFLGGETVMKSFLTDLGVSAGFSTAEKLLVKASGPVGQILNGAFIAGSAQNLGEKIGSMGQSVGTGYVIIGNEIEQPRIETTIACPVDVEITLDGETLSNKPENFNLLTSWGSLSLSGANLDIKTVTMYQDVLGEQKLYGTGNGTMDYSLRAYAPDGSNAGEFVFKNVPITPSTIITPTILDNLVLQIDSNGDGKIDSTIQATSGVSDGASSWAVESIEKADAIGLTTYDLLNGFQSTTTRIEFCRAAVNLLRKYGYDVDSVTPKMFSDTSDRDIGIASALGITNGTDTVKNTFSPNNTLTREQAATLLNNVLGVLGLKKDTTTIAWTDANTISSWALQAASDLYNCGVISGTSTEKLVFSPKTPYTHEQSIVTLLRMWEYIGDKTVSPTTLIEFAMKTLTFADGYLSNATTDTVLQLVTTADKAVTKVEFYDGFMGVSLGQASLENGKFTSKEFKLSEGEHYLYAFPIIGEEIQWYNGIGIDDSGRSYGKTLWVSYGNS